MDVINRTDGPQEVSVRVVRDAEVLREDTFWVASEGSVPIGAWRPHGTYEVVVGWRGEGTPHVAEFHRSYSFMWVTAELTTAGTVAYRTAVP